MYSMGVSRVCIFNKNDTQTMLVFLFSYYTNISDITREIDVHKFIDNRVYSGEIDDDDDDDVQSRIIRIFHIFFTFCINARLS